VFRRRGVAYGSASISIFMTGVGPAVHLRQQVASTADPWVMLYHAVLREGGSL